MPHTNERCLYTSTAWQLLVLTERPASAEQIQMPPLAFFTILCCLPCCVLAAHSTRAGPKAMIINQFSGSGGDWMPFHFKQRGLVRKKRHFLRHLCIKCIILPRQARDKHRESAQKRVAFVLGQAGRQAHLGRPRGNLRRAYSVSHLCNNTAETSAIRVS